MFAKKTMELPSNWNTACEPACEFVPRWPKNLKSSLCVLRLASASFLKTWVETVNSPVPASAWKNAVLNPFGFTFESATEKIPSCHWNCKPGENKVLKAFTDVRLGLITIHVEIPFERIEVEIIVVEPPCPVFPGAVNNQRIIEPVGEISEAVVAVIIVDRYTRQSLSIRNNSDWNFKSTQDNIRV